MTEDPLEVFAARHDETSPLEAMEQLTDRLRRRCGQTAPPIDLEGDMLRVLRATVVPSTSPEGRRARLDLVGGCWRVQINGGTQWVRRRFAVAHEIAHMLVLDTLADRPDLVRALRSGDVMPRLEALCSQAAAALLMPRADVLRQLHESAFDVAGITRLTRRYTVSSWALLIRVSDLTAAGASMWRAGLKRNDPPTLYRVAQSTGLIWVPTGISSPKHLDVDIVARAGRDGHAREQRIEIKYGGSRVVGRAGAARVAPDAVLLLMWPVAHEPPPQDRQLALDLPHAAVGIQQSLWDDPDWQPAQQAAEAVLT